MAAATETVEVPNVEIVDENESELKESCGVFGCIASGTWPTSLEVAQVITVGLVALQHRGQESAGIVTSEGADSKKVHVHKGMGLVSEVFNSNALNNLKGNLGVGHVRYSTTGDSELANCQPFVVHSKHGALTVAHNGELVNAAKLREKLFERGIGFSTQSDSEMITQALCVHLPEVERDGPNWLERIKYFMSLSPLSYSLVIMHKDRIFGVRDPFGNRPLCLGKLIPSKKLEDPKQDVSTMECRGWVIASESCGFFSVGARYLRDVAPGEIVELTKDEIKTIGQVNLPRDQHYAFCIFEYIYFARPDSIFNGRSVFKTRLQVGKQLAIEWPCDADIVSAVPETGLPVAQGYAMQSGIRFAEVLCKNRYVGRTFIQPSTRLRQLAVAKKFGALVDNIEYKKIILIDDSIVRGNTIAPIIQLLRDAGAAEVHIRIASPPVKHPCYMGINIPTHDELIANKLNAAELAEAVGADSLEYLSIEGLLEALTFNDIDQNNKAGFCSACLTGKYPTTLDW